MWHTQKKEKTMQIACEEAQLVDLADKHFRAIINVFKENLVSRINGRYDDNILAKNVYH